MRRALAIAGAVLIFGAPALAEEVTIEKRTITKEVTKEVPEFRQHGIDRRRRPESAAAAARRDSAAASGSDDGVDRRPLELGPGGTELWLGRRPVS